MSNEPSKLDLQELLTRWIRLAEDVTPPDAKWLARREELTEETMTAILNITGLKAHGSQQKS